MFFFKAGDSSLWIFSCPPKTLVAHFPLENYVKIVIIAGLWSISTLVKANRKNITRGAYLADSPRKRLFQLIQFPDGAYFLNHLRLERMS